jgi:uncharacterized protein (DUF885 family)
MRRRNRAVLGWSGLLLLASAVFLVPTIWLRPWSIDHYYARIFLEYALRHPMLLSSLGILDSTPIRYFADDLDDLSVAFQRKEVRFLDRQIRILHGYRRSPMSPSQRLSYDVLDWYLTDQQRNNRFLFHGYPVNQLAGIQSALPDFMMNTHPLTRPGDAVNYVKRVARFGVALDQVIGGLELRERNGIIPPRFVMREVLDQMKDFVRVAPVENPLYRTFAARLDTMPRLKPAERARLLGRLQGEIEHTVYPAYGRLIRFCTHLESVATNDDGVWKLPDGDAYYDQCLRSYTTTEIPADTIHALGLREVARIQDQVRGILAARGYPTADLAASLEHVQDEPRFHYPGGDSGRAQILRDYQAILDDANRRVGSLFGARPKFGVQVKRVPAFMERTAPGAYYQPSSIGGARPGVFFVNLRDPKETKKPAMRTLAYHEGIPGHHFQITIAQELKGVPFFRRIVPFTAYDEGWGLYAERLALEQGFQRDAFDSIGALQAELFRAVRLVVDTGIHRKRWTREQAIRYMVENTGLPESQVVTEVERYIVNPGQACAYKVGQLEILELRRRAMDRLGPRFDLKRFHDVVLTNGALPLTLLDRVVEDWIAAESRRVAAERSG